MKWRKSDKSIRPCFPILVKVKANGIIWTKKKAGYGSIILQYTIWSWCFAYGTISFYSIYKRANKKQNQYNGNVWAREIEKRNLIDGIWKIYRNKIDSWICYATKYKTS